MHRALYRKYRPTAFSDVVGQDHITSVLRYQVSGGRTSHAYLFCGSRGTGKTTCAKILAKAVNCLSPIDGDPCGICENCLAIENGTTADVLEMDAASNTGVDYIRDIKDAVMYAPAMLKTKVYIIDEVHMLSDGAFNALLKTLEEPPSNVIFILATTEVRKIPATILSRCQRFEFRRIAGGVIADRLRYIAGKEGIVLDDDAAFLIARNAQGGMRDAISLLEICSADGEKVDAAVVEALSGGAGRHTVERTVKALAARDAAELFLIVAQLYESSGDLSFFWQELIAFYRDMIVCKTVRTMNPQELCRDVLDLTESEFGNLSVLAEKFKYETLLYHFTVLDEAFDAIGGRRGVSNRIAVEMALVRMTFEGIGESTEALLERISRLEDRLNGGAFLSEASNAANLSGKVTAQSCSLNKSTQEAVSLPRYREDDPLSMREIKHFAEILHNYMKVEPGAASFLAGSKAYFTEDGNVSVQVSGEFALTMLNSKNAAEALESIIQQVEGISVKVRFVCAPPENLRKDAFDDFV